MEGKGSSQNLHLTTHNIYKRHASSSARFEPAIPASEWPQTYGLIDRASTRIGT
jgi:hypothetical protein